MSLMERLLALVSKTGPSSAAGSDPEKVAVAALLVHVARVDGVFVESEQRSLRALLRGRFGLDAEAADDLAERAEQIDREIGDISDLVEQMGHAFGPEERRRVLVMAYAMAAADGRIAEFEDDLVWRLGRLFGFDDAEIQEIRAQETGDLSVAANDVSSGR